MILPAQVYSLSSLDASNNNIIVGVLYQPVGIIGTAGWRARRAGQYSSPKTGRPINVSRGRPCNIIVLGVVAQQIVLGSGSTVWWLGSGSRVRCFGYGSPKIWVWE